MTLAELYSLSLPEFVRLLQSQGALGSAYLEAQAAVYLAGQPGGTGTYSDGTPIPPAAARYAIQAMQGIERSPRTLARLTRTEVSHVVS